jgi:hypothetical protein
MHNKIVAKIDVTKIAKGDLFEGAKGVYLDAVLIPNKDGQSKYGDDGFIVQGLPKEKRDKGERGVILGNWRFLAGGNRSNQAEGGDDSNVPF